MWTVAQGCSSPVLYGQDEIEAFLAYLRGDASTLLAAANLDGDETTFRCVPEVRS